MNDIHESDAAYVLGALSSEDRRAFETHLAECAQCRASVADLAGMPGLLSLVDKADAVTLLDEPTVASASSAIVTRLARAEVRTRRRDRIVAGGLLAAAAAVVAVALLIPRAAVVETPVPLAMEQVVPGVVTAELSVTEKGWGTRFDWSCDYGAGLGDYDVTVPTYVLVAIDDTGAEHIVASWQATGGDRAGGLSASSSLPYDSIRAVEIRYAGSDSALVRTEL